MEAKGASRPTRLVNDDRSRTLGEVIRRCGKSQIPKAKETTKEEIMLHRVDSSTSRYIDDRAGRVSWDLSIISCVSGRKGELHVRKADLHGGNRSYC